MFVWSTPRLWSVVLLSVVAAGASPAPVSACDYGYMALPQVFDASTDVFVGTVTESRFSRGVDGQLIVRSRPTEDVPTVRFKVLTPYKGAAGDEVILSEDLSDCTFPFLQGATYMIHAFMSDGRLISGQASRPILISLPDGSRAQRDPSEPATYWSPELAMAYADARAHQRPHAFITGRVFLIGRDGVTASTPVSDDVVVYAERAGAPPAVVRVPNTPSNIFEMVLSPGEYRFIVRRAGTQLGDAVTLRVADGESRTVNLGPGWSR